MKSHASGKLVVIAIFVLALGLGVVGFFLRNTLPKWPTTQPSTNPR